MIRRVLCWLLGHDRTSVRFVRTLDREFAARYRAKTGAALTIVVRCALCGSPLTTASSGRPW